LLEEFYFIFKKSQDDKVIQSMSELG